MAGILPFRTVESLSILFHSSFSLLNDEYGTCKAFWIVAWSSGYLSRIHLSSFIWSRLYFVFFEWGNYFSECTSRSKQHLWLSFGSVWILYCWSDSSSSFLVISSWIQFWSSASVSCSIWIFAYLFSWDSVMLLLSLLINTWLTFGWSSILPFDDIDSCQLKSDKHLGTLSSHRNLHLIKTILLKLVLSLPYSSMYMILLCLFSNFWNIASLVPLHRLFAFFFQMRGVHCL